MRILKIALAVLAALAVVVLLAAPIGPLPGVFIGGTATPPPATWEDTSGIDEIRLKAPGAIPRVVIIWVIDVGGELYVVGMKESGWTQRIGDGAPVEVRIGDATYAARQFFFCCRHDKKSFLLLQLNGKCCCVVVCKEE